MCAKAVDELKAARIVIEKSDALFAIEQQKSNLKDSIIQSKTSEIESLRNALREREIEIDAQKQQISILAKKRTTFVEKISLIALGIVLGRNARK